MVDSVPKNPKNRTQPPTKTLLPQQCTNGKGEGIRHTQIPAADTKTQIDPCPKQCRNKNEISQPTGAEVPQKPIEQTEPPAQQETLP